jgi:uncharacterized protein
MDKKAHINEALKTALRSGDLVRKRTLRMVLSSIQMAEVEHRRPLSEAEILSILQKEVKTRQESLAEARLANRAEMASAVEDEIAVLQEYLPQPFSQEELEALVKEVIGEVGAASPADMGKVMKVLMPRLQGRASGEQASQVVRQQLQ